MAITRATPMSDANRIRSSHRLVALAAIVPLAASALLTALHAQSSTPENADKLFIVDCLLPGQVRKLGSQTTFLTARRPAKLSASECELRGGEYVAYDRSNLSTALQVWLPLASQGDKEAQTYVGEIYEKGIPGTAPDYAAAVTWYQKAADQGFPRALINLGFLYEKGLGVKKDPAAALNLYRKASGLEGLITLESDAAAANAVNAAQANELKALRQQLDDVTAELERARTELQRRQSDTERQQLERQRQQAREQGNTDAVKRLEAQLRRRDDELDQQRRNVARLEQTVAGYRKQLSGAATESAALRTETEALRTESAALRSESAALRDQLDKMRQQVAASQSDLEQRRQKAIEDERRRDDVKRQLEKQKQSSTPSPQNTDLIRKLEAQLKAREDDIARQAQESERIEKEAQRYKDQLARLEAQSRDQLAKVEAQGREQLAKADAQSREQLAKAEAQREQLIKAEALTREQLAKAEAQREQLAKAGAQSREQLAKAEAQREQLAKTQAQIREQLAKLEAQNKEQQAKLDAAAKAAPAKSNDAAGAGPLNIQLIDPPLVTTRNAAVAKIRGDVPVREIVGKVTAPAGVVSFMVNDKTETLDKNGMFKTRVTLLKPATSVSMVAIDNRGQRAVLEFSLVPEGGAEVAAAPAKAIPKLEYGKYYALVIGNEKYQFLPKLDTAVADVKAVAEVLEKRYGFKVTALYNATRYQVLSEMNKLRSQLTDKDNLLIYYAGHGELDRANARGHWLPVDAEPKSDANWISTVAITDILNAMTVKHVLVIADSCYSGAMTRSSIGQLKSGLSDEARANWLKALIKTRSRTVWTSGGLQPVMDGGGGQHSVFAKYFLEVLRENRDVTEAQSLYGEVASRVLNAASQFKFEQKPEYAPLKFAGHESGDFIFVPAT